MSRLNEGCPFSKNRNSGDMLPRADTKKSTPAKISERLRPNRKANIPLRAEPMMQPISALAQVNPCQASV